MARAATRTAAGAVLVASVAALALTGCKVPDVSTGGTGNDHGAINQPPDPGVHLIVVGTESSRSGTGATHHSVDCAPEGKTWRTAQHNWRYRVTAAQEDYYGLHIGAPCPTSHTLLSSF